MARLRKLSALVAVVAATGMIPSVSWGQDFTFSVESPTTLAGTLFTSNQTIRHSSAPPGYALAFDGGTAGLGQNVGIDALTFLPGGNFLFSTDAPFTVSGITYLPADVVRYSPAVGQYSLHLSGFSLGLSDSANIDSLGFDALGRLAMSFDAPETVGGIDFAPGDVAVLSGGALSVLFTGSSIGIPPDANVIGYERASDGSDLLEFDVPLTLGGIDIVPGSIARSSGGAWTVYFSDASFPPDSTGRDLALPCNRPAYSGQLAVRKAGGSTEVSWPVGGASLFDLVRGSLSVLRANQGNFTAALDAITPGSDVCMVNDGPVSSVIDTRVDPSTGDGCFYVLRPVAGCGAPGTYDSGSPKQVAGRDLQIAAAAADCP